MLNKNIKHIIYSFYTYTDKQTAAPGGAIIWEHFIEIITIILIFFIIAML